MRFKISEELGSAENKLILKAFEDAPNDVYATEVTKYIDFFWEKYKMQIIMFNLTYVIYPILIGFFLASSNSQLHDYW